MKIISSKFGKNLRIEISGGSHEKELLLKIWGLPDDFKYDLDDLTPYLKDRQGGTKFTTPRFESDIPEIINTNPLTIRVKNSNYDSGKYNLDTPRPSHADYTAKIKYKDTVNMVGGGPFSGRMTVMMTIAGGIADIYLKNKGIDVTSEILSIGGVPFSCSDEILKDTMKANDSIGGICRFKASGFPAGIGGCMFDGLESRLTSALFAIPGVKGVDFGSGILAASMKGSENNDAFVLKHIDNSDECDKYEYLKNIVKTETNNHGGILGGISSGMPITGKVYFKPTPSISKPQKSFDFNTLKPVIIETNGRHDPCIAIRGNAVVKAIVSLVLLDEYLDYEKSLSENISLHRAYIDALDNKITELLEKRFKACFDIGHIKSEMGLNVLDSGREQAIKENLYASFPDFSSDIIDEIYDKIFDVSKDIQTKENKN